MPQKMKNLFWHLSAKYPKIGCKRYDETFAILIIVIAAAISTPTFAVINGSIGAINPG